MDQEGFVDQVALAIQMRRVREENSHVCHRCEPGVVRRRSQKVSINRFNISAMRAIQHCLERHKAFPIALERKQLSSTAA